MNKFEYDNAKAELAVLEQNYSDMERIMELKEQITRYESANPSWPNSNGNRQDSTKSADYNKPKGTPKNEKSPAASAGDTSGNYSFGTNQAGASKTPVRLPGIMDSFPEDFPPPTIYKTEKEANLSDGANWFTTDSLENIGKQILYWSSVNLPGAPAVVKDLLATRALYRIYLDVKDSSKKFSKLPIAPSPDPVPSAQNVLSSAPEYLPIAYNFIKNNPSPLISAASKTAETVAKYLPLGKENHSLTTPAENNLTQSEKQSELPPTAITAKDAALMSQHLYGYKDFPSDYLTSDYREKRKVGDGWRLIDIIEGSEGMVTGVYVRGDGEHSSYKGPKEYAVVNKGTETLSDWVNNLEQPTGTSTDMKESIDLAKYFNDGEWGKYGMTFVGHSKGGAEATANAVATGRNAIVFNPAAALLAPYGLDKNKNSSKISKYIVDGEILNTVNERLGLSALGTEYPLYFSSKNPIKKHSIEAILDGLERENR